MRRSLTASKAGSEAGAETGRPRRQLPDGLRVLDQGEAHQGIGQRRHREVVLDVGELGFLGAEKFLSGGDVEEQLSHLDGGAAGSPGGFYVHQFAAEHYQLGGLAVAVLLLPGGEGEPAHARDARQCLTPETHGGDGAEVGGFLDLGGGVALQAEQGVIATHSESVVGDPDQAPSARLHLHGDARCAGIEGVFDQLLHDAGGTLHHLASGDLVGDLLGQKANAVHGRGAWIGLE